MFTAVTFPLNTAFAVSYPRPAFIARNCISIGDYLSYFLDLQLWGNTQEVARLMTDFGERGDSLQEHWLIFWHLSLVFLMNKLFLLK